MVPPVSSRARDTGTAIAYIIYKERIQAATGTKH